MLLIVHRNPQDFDVLSEISQDGKKVASSRALGVPLTLPHVHTTSRNGAGVADSEEEDGDLKVIEA